ncbi:RadC family protein [Proteus mirabilis]|uniref:RadC family protein n=1 Tax=Proteus mirabilis TaxID=584 RepID=UPI000CEC16E4|nr:DNA repair protein RadC [Proteus mirabilis]MDU1883351.1 DNA repair protein RadC [Proteus mirabilis]ROD49289.1 JAB domain-containing protein [Proteus mirabilis]HCT6310414.1 DNA repair protein RadC [Proteus mirabilis]HEK1831150.1 DNA repair protein RadC [Proteus mirabilis]
MENATIETLLPREKLLLHGVESLTDVELLAIFLRTGTYEKSVLELADFLLRKCGSLYHVINADYETLGCFKGIGVGKFTQLQAINEMAQRFIKTKFMHKNILSSSAETKSYLQKRLNWRDREVFVVLFLDNQNQMIDCEEMFKGTVDRVEVHPREIIRQSIKKNAASIILAHNHPSGLSEPSLADKQITEKIFTACQLVGIKVLDHLVVGHDNCVSFAERGWL